MINQSLGNAGEHVEEKNVKDDVLFFQKRHSTKKKVKQNRSNSDEEERGS